MHQIINNCIKSAENFFRCKAEEEVDASASTTDDNAAYGGKMVQISKEMIETVH